MKRILCVFGFHKWSFESKNLVKHKREANYKSAFAYFEYGSSNYYQYECEICAKKQWYSERICVGIGLNRTYRTKINI